MDMQQTEYQALVESLAKNARTIQLGDAQIELRDCADRRPGYLDPRTSAAYAATRKDFETPGKMDPELAANYEKLLGPPDASAYDELALIRYTFGWRSSDKSTGINTKRHILYAAGRPFKLYEYRGDAAPGAPCMVFIHGGGFVAGDIETVENQCKLLAQMSGGVVFSVDYPMAPEYPFPAGFEACKAAVDWVSQNAAALGIDAKKIGVGGDSAGGNLSLALSIDDRDSSGGKIAYQCLIYPKVSGAKTPEDPHYYWDASLYENPGNDPVIEDQIRSIGKSSVLVSEWYNPGKYDDWDKRISPVSAPCEGLPPTLLMYAEYDFLRADCDVYAGLLQKAGVKGKAIRYGGITHGTFDRLGYAPQVEDMLREMSLMMKAL